ncbi:MULTISPECIES: hypothetical protein [unclassified Streptomyces]|nr:MULTISPECIES: hypothetical protein [unclassified Streptomyces]
MEWLLWFAVLYAVGFAYCVIDVPDLCARAAHLIADRIRHGGIR